MHAKPLPVVASLLVWFTVALRARLVAQYAVDGAREEDGVVWLPLSHLQMLVAPSALSMTSSSSVRIVTWTAAEYGEPLCLLSTQITQREAVEVCVQSLAVVHEKHHVVVVVVLVDVADTVVRDRHIALVERVMMCVVRVCQCLSLKQPSFGEFAVTAVLGKACSAKQR